MKRLFFLLVALLPGLASAQTVLSTQVIGRNTGGLTALPDSAFGRSFAPLGDLDADGRPDVAVTDDRNVWILFLNANGTVKAYQKIGPYAQVYAVENLGDLNGDGITDVVLPNHGCAGPDPEALYSGRSRVLYLNTNGTLKGTGYLSPSSYCQKHIQAEETAANAARANGRWNNPNYRGLIGDLDGNGHQDRIRHYLTYIPVTGYDYGCRNAANTAWDCPFLRQPGNLCNNVTCANMAPYFTHGYHAITVELMGP